ncbi:MAG: radical SAM protein [Eubacterium sp.]|nr:radical SAM protein [Eubacterium sp.]
MDATIEQRLFAKAAGTHTPISAGIELLPLCNMDCDMCFVRLGTEEMKRAGSVHSADEWLKLAENMQKAGTLFLMLTGGEPLLYPEFKRLYRSLKQMGFVITVNTNGTLIDDEWADFFAQYPPRRMNITLYGADADTYRSLCHYEDGYEKAIRAIQLLRDRKVDVKINVSMVKDNQDDIQKLITYADEVGAGISIDTYMYPAVRERERKYDDQVRVDAKEAARGKLDFLRTTTEREQYQEILREHIMRKHETEAEQSVEMKMNCQAGKTSFAVNWQGFMRPCVMMTQPSYPVFEMDFLDAWKKLSKELDKIRLGEDCASCEYRKVCSICPAKAYWETGSIKKKPEYLCRYTKELFCLMEKEWESYHG